MRDEKLNKLLNKTYSNGFSDCLAGNCGDRDTDAEWSTTPPTEDGYYWIKYMNGHTEISHYSDGETLGFHTYNTSGALYRPAY